MHFYNHTNSKKRVKIGSLVRSGCFLIALATYIGALIYLLVFFNQ